MAPTEGGRVNRGQFVNGRFWTSGVSRENLIAKKIIRIRAREQEISKELFWLYLGKLPEKGKLP
jgi:hypothetical protein